MWPSTRQQTYFTLWFRSGQWRVWVHIWEEEAWAHRSSDSKGAQMLRPKYGSADQINGSHGLFLEDLFDADWSPQQSGSPLTHYNQNSRRSDQSANIKLGLLEGSQSIKMKCYCGPPRHYRDTTPNRKSHRSSNPLQHQRSRLLPWERGHRRREKTAKILPSACSVWSGQPKETLEFIDRRKRVALCFLPFCFHTRAIWGWARTHTHKPLLECNSSVFFFVYFCQKKSHSVDKCRPDEERIEPWNENEKGLFFLKMAYLAWTWWL